MNSAKISRCCCAVVCLSMTMTSAQSYGTINLPASLCESGTVIQRAATSTPPLNQWCEGPAVAGNGTLFFSEQMSGNIWKVALDGAMTKLVNVGTYSNGLDFHPLTGHLVVCEKSRIAERDTATGAVLKTIALDDANAWTGGGSGGSNDLTFASNGDMFFTSWNQHIYFYSNDGAVHTDWNFPTAYGTCNWNGIEYIEEKGFIYVCQYGKNRVVTFKVNAATHLIDTSTMKQFGPAINSPDGITVDSNYNVYVCSNSAQGSYPNSVVVLDSSGKALGSIKMAQANSSVAVNCVFGTSMSGGGPNPHTLYVTGDSGAFKIQLKVAGRVRPATTALALPYGKDCFHGRPALPLQGSAYYGNSTAAYPGTLAFFDFRGVKLTLVGNKAYKSAKMSSGMAVVRTAGGKTALVTTVR
jgi:sugar lactone lactonase YvrE